MKKALWPLMLVLGLSGCASLQDIMNVLSGTNAQKITRTPIWVYKPDIEISVDGHAFLGYGVGILPQAGKSTDISVWSLVNIDRVEISTCSRHDVCQVKGGALACDANRFQVDKSWFGNAGKYMVYHFAPDKKELDDSCANMTIAIYDKNALAAWGFLAFRVEPNPNFPAKFTCNATDWQFLGVSVCSAKAGTIQELNSPETIDWSKFDDSCGASQISKTEMEFKPEVGWCRGTIRHDFPDGPKFHDVIINGYDEILIRDGG